MVMEDSNSSGPGVPGHAGRSSPGAVREVDLRDRPLIRSIRVGSVNVFESASRQGKLRRHRACRGARPRRTSTAACSPRVLICAGCSRLSMDIQRDRLFSALTRIVWSLDSPDSMASYLGQLGRDHRKYGVIAEHYTAVGNALLATIKRFSAEAWTVGDRGRLGGRLHRRRQSHDRVGRVPTPGVPRLVAGRGDRPRAPHAGHRGDHSASRPAPAVPAGPVRQRADCTLAACLAHVLHRERATRGQHRPPARPRDPRGLGLDRAGRAHADRRHRDVRAPRSAP